MKNEFFHKEFDTFLNSRAGKDYYLGIQKERNYGEDPQGNEWQKIEQELDKRGHTEARL